MILRQYTQEDLPQMVAIWNEVVEDGVAFPQKELLTPEKAEKFFSAQTFTCVAEEDGKVLGLYILHPNNEGRCGHIGNASYAVDGRLRGRHIGEKLVRHSLEMAPKSGFRILQFNAVVQTNTGALHLYEKLGFIRLGTIPGGFYTKEGVYEDIVLFYYLFDDTERKNT